MILNSERVAEEKYIGQQLKNDIFNKMGVLLIPALTTLNLEHLQMLEQHQIWLSDSDVQETPKNDTSLLIEDTVAEIRDIFDEIRYSQTLPIVDIRQQIIPAIKQASEQPSLFSLFFSLQSKDDYTYRHNIGVGVLSTLLGRWLNLEEPELSHLTMAATLHDVGKMKIPIEILNKPGKFTAEEFALMKKHTIFGYEMIEKTVGTSHRQALVALQHHERIDGTGYPFGLTKEKLDYFSRIVAVADVFHAMTSKRPYRNPAPFFQTLREMYNNAFGPFDSQIIYVFVHKMMQYIVGNEVLLTDGRKGKIVMVNPHDLFSPLIAVDDTFMDIGKDSSVQIEQILT